MALEELTKKISDDASESAERIRAAARESMAALEREAASREKAARAVYERETADLVLKQRTLTQEKTAQEARVLLEVAQRDLLDRTFAEALTQAVSATGSAYRAYLAAPLARIAASKDVINVVYAPSGRVEETKAALTEAGINALVEVRDSIQGGLVAVGETCEYDARFEQTLAQVQRTHESEIARMLFSA